MIQNLTILKKGLILIAIPCLFLVVFVAILFKINSDAVLARKWALHSKTVIASTNSVLLNIIETQATLRLLAIVADVPMLGRLDRNLEKIPADLAVLRELVNDKPSQVGKVSVVEEKVRDLLGWQRSVSDLVRAGRQEEALGQVRSLQGQFHLDEVRQAIGEFIATEDSLNLARMDRLDRIANLQTGVLTVGAILSPIFVVFLSIVFWNTINQRLSVLADNSRRLADGQELSSPLEGRDEIAQIDRIFHSMAQSLAAKNRENEMFIYSVSHDLRSPLVNLQGFSQELGHSLNDLREIVEANPLPDRVKEKALDLIEADMGGSIRYIQTAVSRLSVIIDALLRLSRAGRVEYRWGMVDLEGIVGRVVDSLNGSIVRSGASVERRPIPPAWGDSTALEQLFGNLIVNAVHYLDPARPGRIEVGAVEGGSTARSHTYYVRDNGLGVPEAALPRLFQAFQRFHAGTTRGEGIGLALVRRIIDRHGGRIRVESREGQGTTFFIELPARPPETAARPESSLSNAS